MNVKKQSESKISGNTDDIEKKRIQDAINKGDYQLAEEILQKYKKVFKKYDDIIAILEAGIGEYNGDRNRMWEAIRKGLMFNARNYELYVMLGNYYLSENIYQSYLCYENALFYCDNTKDKLEIGQLLCQLSDQYNVIINKIYFIILSYNLLEKIKLCIKSIRTTTIEYARKIVVVDNGSSDGSIEWLREQNDIILIENKEKIGFSQAYNQGICERQENDDIFLMSVDTILLPNTLLKLPTSKMGFAP